MANRILLILLNRTHLFIVHNCSFIWFTKFSTLAILGYALCSWAMWPIFSLFQINYVYVWFYRKSVSIIVNEWVHSCQKTSCNCSISVQSSIYFNVIWPRSENRKFGFKTAWAKYSYEPTQSNGICVRNPLNKNIKEFWVVARRLQTWKFMFPFAFIYDTVEKWTLLFYGSHKGSYINDSIWFSIFFLLLFR